MRFRWWRRSFCSLALCFLGASCSVAATPTPVADPWSDWVKQERVIPSPGGLTRLEFWFAQGERDAKAVRAQRYVSGMSLARGIALVFHATQRMWMLSLNGQLTPLQSLPEGQGPVPLLAPGEPVVNRYAFDHDGRHWQLAVLSRQDPIALPGIATEQQPNLDLLIWQTPLR